MVEDKFKLVFIISLVAVILVFLSGIVLGWTIDNMRENSLSDTITESELDVESFIIEQQLIAGFNGETCSILGARISDLQKQASDIGRTIEDYEEGKSSAADYNYMKRKHIIMNLRLWLLMEQLNSKCGESQKSIIYFYEQDCRACLMQGFVLDDLNREANNTIRVFAYDADFAQEPLIKLLKDKYGVRTAPTIIFGETKMEGLVTKEELQSLLTPSIIEKV